MLLSVVVAVKVTLILSFWDFVDGGFASKKRRKGMGVNDASLPNHHRAVSIFSRMNLGRGMEDGRTTILLSQRRDIE